MDGSASACSPRLSTPVEARRRPRRRLGPVAAACAACALLAAVVAAIEAGRPFLLLPLCQLAVSLGGLELAWLCFRVRARLLLALGAALPSLDDREDPQRQSATAATARTQEGYRYALRAAVTPSGFAVKWLTDKTPVTGGREVPVALSLSVLAAAAVVALVILCLPMLVSLPKYQLSWWLVVITGGLGAFLSVLTACLSPTGPDSVLLLVLQGCFTFSRMNMVVAHYQNGIHSDPEVIDDLYLTLTGCCIMIAWRIVSSTDVLHTLLAALLDTVIVVYVLATMMEIADFVDHPYAREFPFFFSTFFLSVAAGELTRWAFQALVVDGNAQSSRWRSRAAQRRRVEEERCAPLMCSIGAAMVSAVSACIATAVAFVCIPRRHPVRVELLGLFPLAAVVSHVGQAMLAMVKETALVSKPARLSVWRNGALDLMNPFLLAWIVVHPYSKYLLATASSYDDGDSGGSSG
jgi:hypothetical protein